MSTQIFPTVPANLLVCPVGETVTLIGTDWNMIKQNKAAKFYRKFDPNSPDHDPRIHTISLDNITMKLSTAITHILPKGQTSEAGYEVVKVGREYHAGRKGVPVCKIEDVAHKCVDILDVMHGFGQPDGFTWIEFYQVQNGEEVFLDTLAYLHLTPENVVGK